MSRLSPPSPEFLTETDPSDPDWQPSPTIKNKYFPSQRTRVSSTNPSFLSPQPGPSHSTTQGPTSSLRGAIARHSALLTEWSPWPPLYPSSSSEEES